MNQDPWPTITQLFLNTFSNDAYLALLHSSSFFSVSYLSESELESLLQSFVSESVSGSTLRFVLASFRL